MKKPSLKNKLTADKIEEANRLLSEQTKATNQPSAVISQPKVIQTDNSVAVQVAEKATGVAQKAAKKENIKPKAMPKQSIVRPSKESKYVRVTIDVPEDLHEKLKIKMILSKQTIKDYLLNFIEKDLGKMEYKF